MLTNNIFCVFYFRGLRKPQKKFLQQKFPEYGIREMWFVDCSCMDYWTVLQTHTMQRMLCMHELHVLHVGRGLGTRLVGGVLEELYKHMSPSHTL